jgi:DNA polymerase-4
MFAHVLVPGFHAAVHQLAEPALRGRPVAVAVDARGALLGATSREAQVRGVFPGASAADAHERCPALAVRQPDVDAYRLMQAAVSDRCARVTPTVGSGNGAWDLDLGAADVAGPLGSEQATGLALALRQDLAERLGLAAVIGVAPTLLGARLAARLAANPRITRLGVVTIRPGDEELVTAPLPVDWLPGMTTDLLTRLHRRAIATIGALRKLEDGQLVAQAGEAGRGLRQLVHGELPLPLMPYQDAEPQVSVELSAGQAGVGPAQILGLLGAGSADLREQLVEHGFGGRRLSLTVRWSDGRIGHESLTREAQFSASELATVAERLLVQIGERACAWSWLRLAVGGLCPLEQQLELFAPEPSRSWEAARERHGGVAMRESDAALAAAG